MDGFDDVQKRMLGTEWLAKVDIETATPYLLKFHAEESELACSLMITDTKSIWFETLTGNQLARRWRECHPLKSKPNPTSQEEETWRKGVLTCLSAAHTIGNFAEMSFEVVKSLYSLFKSKDFAFELRLGDFVFRWETNTAGHRHSAAVISTQLIMPLMSTAHLAFSSPCPVGEMSESDLETVVDRLGRAARRTPGMHARNAISRPRLATAIRRMTAMLNFLVELPNVQLDAEKLDITSPDLAPPTSVSEIQIAGHSTTAADIEMGEPAVLNAQPKDAPHWLESAPTKSRHRSWDALGTSSSKAKSEEDSATGSSDDGQQMSKKLTPPVEASNTRSSVPADGKKVDHSTSSSDLPKEARRPTKKTVASDSPPPPARPPVTKKAEPAVSSSSGSEKNDEVAAGQSTRRGARQPIKRGGRRF